MTKEIAQDCITILDFLKTRKQSYVNDIKRLIRQCNGKESHQKDMLYILLSKAIEENKTEELLEYYETVLENLNEN